MEFFMPMKDIPNTTHQQKKVTVAKNGKPVFYEPAELKAAREKLTAHLAKFVPKRNLRSWSSCKSNGYIRMVITKTEAIRRLSQTWTT